MKRAKKNLLARLIKDKILNWMQESDFETISNVISSFDENDEIYNICKEAIFNFLDEGD